MLCVTSSVIMLQSKEQANDQWESKRRTHCWTVSSYSFSSCTEFIYIKLDHDLSKHVYLNTAPQSDNLLAFHSTRCSQVCATTVELLLVVLFTCETSWWRRARSSCDATADGSFSSSLEQPDGCETERQSLWKPKLSHQLAACARCSWRPPVCDHRTFWTTSRPFTLAQKSSQASMAPMRVYPRLL